MKVSMFQVDAFTGEGLHGNRAAVCLLDKWLPDEVLQALAERHALSETAYLVPEVGAYDLRWFTPTTEVDLCGHATLAAAYVVMAHLEPGRQEVAFKSRSGTLGVKREGELYVLDFPSRASHPIVGGRPRWSTRWGWLRRRSARRRATGCSSTRRRRRSSFSRPTCSCWAPSTGPA